MLQVFGTFLFIVFCGSLSLGAAENIPVANDQISFFVKALNSTLKIDSSLKKVGLEPLVCQYKSPSARTKTFSGIGACLYENLNDSRKKIHGREIKAWFKNSDQKTIAAQIIWNPSDEGWRSIRQELFRLYSAGRFWERFFSSHELPFKKGFLGDIQVVFAEPVHVHDLSFPESHWTEDIEISQVTLQTKPAGISEGAIQYAGQFAIKKSVVEDADGSLIQLNFQTTFNFLKPRRSADWKLQMPRAEENQ